MYLKAMKKPKIRRVPLTASVTGSEVALSEELEGVVD
jgi:hypothetical protein